MLSVAAWLPRSADKRMATCAHRVQISAAPRATQLCSARAERRARASRPLADIERFKQESGRGRRGGPARGAAARGRGGAGGGRGGGGAAGGGLRRGAAGARRRPRTNSPAARFRERGTVVEGVGGPVRASSAAAPCLESILWSSWASLSGSCRASSRSRARRRDHYCREGGLDAILPLHEPPWVDVPVAARGRRRGDPEDDEGFRVVPTRWFRCARPERGRVGSSGGEGRRPWRRARAAATHAAARPLAERLLALGQLGRADLRAADGLLTTDERPAQAGPGDLDIVEGRVVDVNSWTWTAYLVEVIECESGFFARSPL